MFKKTLVFCPSDVGGHADDRAMCRLQIPSKV